LGKIVRGETHIKMTDELKYIQLLLFEEKAGMMPIKNHFNSSVIGNLAKPV
jgi:hypothetical protein